MQVSLKEFIAFEQSGAYFLVRPQTLFSARVDEGAYALICRLAGNACADVSPEEAALLQKLRLTEAHPETAQQRREREACMRARIAGAARPFSTLELMVSQRCNMRCVYCLGGAGEYGHASLMQPAVADAAIDRMYAAYQDAGRTTRPYIMFLGGEPLINFALMQHCIARCEALFGSGTVEYSVSTNGVLVDSDTMDFFEKYHVDVTFSFDGPYQNSNRPLADGSDSHQMITACMREAAARLGYVECLGVYCPGQDPAAMATEYLSMERLFYKTNAVVGSPVTGSPADSCRAAYAMKAAELPARAAQAVDAVRRRDGNGLLQRLRDTDFQSFLIPALSSPAYPRKATHCGAENGRICVDSNGDLYPCHSFVGVERYRLGSVDGAYRPGVFERCLGVIRDKCKDCCLRYGCAGGCRAAFSMLPEAHTCGEPLLHVPEEYCELQRQKMKLHAFIFWSLTDGDRAWIAELLRSAASGDAALSRDF